MRSHSHTYPHACHACSHSHTFTHMLLTYSHIRTLTHIHCSLTGTHARTWPHTHTSKPTPAHTLTPTLTHVLPAVGKLCTGPLSSNVGQDQWEEVRQPPGHRQSVPLPQGGKGQCGLRSQLWCLTVGPQQATCFSGPRFPLLCAEGRSSVLSWAIPPASASAPRLGQVGGGLRARRGSRTSQRQPLLQSGFPSPTRIGRLSHEYV